MLAGYDRAILIDAVPRGGAPGTLYVSEPEMSDAAAAPDAHRMDLENVFALMRMIGGEAAADYHRRVRAVGHRRNHRA